jgi:hypothetical protein
MFFYSPEQPKGMVPTDNQRPKKWNLVPGRVAIAVLAIVALAVIYYFLRGPDHTALAGFVRSLGEIVFGAVVGVLISEQQAAKVINIYVSDRNTDARRDGK